LRALFSTPRGRATLGRRFPRGLEHAKEVTVTHLKCPDCGITIIDRSGLGIARRCPRCQVRTGAIVPMIAGIRGPTTRDIPEHQVRQV
jgi:hypothetical protein